MDVLTREEARRSGQLLDERRGGGRPVVSGEGFEPSVRLSGFPSQETPLQPGDHVSDQQDTGGENGHGGEDSRRIEHTFRLRDEVAHPSRRAEIFADDHGASVPLDVFRIRNRGRKLPDAAEDFTQFLQAYIARWAGSTGVL
jgi:hypothetical protein